MKVTSHLTGQDSDTVLPKVSWATPTKQMETGVINMCARGATGLLPHRLLLAKQSVRAHPRCGAGGLGVHNLPSSSDTSKISSTVSGKLMRCFSVVICEERGVSKLHAGVINQHNLQPREACTMCSLTADTDSSVTSFSTSMTEM